MRLPSGENATLADRALVTAQRLAERLARGRVPQPQRLVLRARDDALAVRRERDARDRALVAAQRLADRLARWPRPTAAASCPTSPRRCACRPARTRRSQTSPSWPRSGSPTGWPVAASHSRSVLSTEPETMRLPSGENATLVTSSLVPAQRLADRLAGGRVPQPQRACRPEPETMRLPSGENATLETAVLVPAQRLADRLAGGRVPQPQRLVHRSPRRCACRPARTRRSRPRPRAAQRLAERLPGCRVPQPQRLVATSPRRCACRPARTRRSRPRPRGRAAARRSAGPSPRPTAAASCRRSPRRCACRPARTRRSRPSPRGRAAARRAAGRSRRPTAAASCPRSPRRCACRRARTRRSRPSLVAAQRLAHRLAGGRVPQPQRLVQEPETMRLPSGENATLETQSSWPRSGSPTGWPVAASHSRSVLS